MTNASRSIWVPLGWLVFATGCSLIAPLGDEYTFGEVCETPPSAEELCGDLCGDLTVCDEIISCGGCDGELGCEQESKLCECARPPCAVTQWTAGDAAAQTVVALAVDNEENVFVAGHFRGALTFGDETHVNDGLTNDIFVVKLDPRGNVLWSRAFGDVEGADFEQSVHALAVDPQGNLVLAGRSSSDLDLGGESLECSENLVTLKLDREGVVSFARCYGTGTIRATIVDIAVDPANHDILAFGNFVGTFVLGGSQITAEGSTASPDLFITRLAADGTPRSLRRFGDAQDQMAEDLTIGGGHLHIAFRFNGSFHFGSPNQTLLEASSWYAGGLTRLTTTLSHRSSVKLGDSVLDVHLSAHPSGDLFVGGKFSNSLSFTTPPLTADDGDAFLVKVDLDDEPLWVHQFQGIEIADLAAGPDGSVTIVGVVPVDTEEIDFSGGPLASSATNDPFIARFGPDGEHVFSRVFSSALGQQGASAVAITREDDLWLGVTFEGEIDLGLGTIMTQGNSDVAAVRFSP